MKRAILAGGLVLLAWMAAAPAAQAQGLPLFTIERNGDQLHTVDPLSSQTLSSATITLGGFTVENATGLARHPQTGQFFALLKIQGQIGRELVTLDTATGAATSIGNTGDDFAAIAFDNNGTLWGVTGDGATAPATLFTLSTADATPTMQLALGTTGCCGESLTFNPSDGLLYHASGEPIDVFESIDPMTLARTSLTINGPNLSNDPNTLAHWRGNFFLLTSFGVSFLVQRTGGGVTIRQLGNFDHSPKGAVFAGAAAPCPPLAQLYGAAHLTSDGPSLFYSLNPANGTPTLIGPVGFERVSGMDFGPGGTLFATGERMDGSDTPVLLTLNPCTGAGAEVGPLNLVGMGPGNDPVPAIRDLSFRRADGVLFGNFPDDNTGSTRLVTINTATGAATDVGGDAALFNPAGGMAFSGTDVLLEEAGQTLFTINPATGAASAPVALNFSAPADNGPRLNALDFRGATLFASLRDQGPPTPEHYLATVDTANGNVAVLGPTEAGLDAIAFTSGVADLFLSKADAPDPIPVMANLTYTVTVANAGPEQATNVVLTDTLPMDVNFTSANASQGMCMEAMGVVTCNIGTLDALASATATIVAVPQMPGPITNTASVTLDQPDPDLANNTATTTTDVVDFTISAMPASVMVTRGNTAVYMVTLTPTASRFDFAITLSCEMLPASTTCAFLPAGVIPGGGPITSTLNVLTTAPSSAELRSPVQAPFYAAWLLAPLGLLVLGAGRRRRARAVLGLLLLLLVLQMGCGGSSEPMTTTNPGTPLGTHTITVRGAVGSLAHTTTVDVVVQ